MRSGFEWAAFAELQLCQVTRVNKSHPLYMSFSPKDAQGNAPDRVESPVNNDAKLEVAHLTMLQWEFLMSHVADT